MMTNYLGLVPRYLSAHRRKSTLVIISVAISVALVTGVFSMLDAFLQFERLQVIHDYGNYHLMVEDATDAEMQAIGERSDVRNSGEWVSLRNGSLNGHACRLSALSEAFAPNMNIVVSEGRYPTAENELMLEGWATQQLGLHVGDGARIVLSDGTETDWVVSGVFQDFGSTKASATPGVLLSLSGAKALSAEKASAFLVEFERGANVSAAQKAIQSSLSLADDRIGRNERLLAVMGQSTNNMVLGLYLTGGILFSIVLIAGVMMIYNTFNISVMERVRQFGLLRCIGASQAQVKKLVVREGLHTALRAIPIGVLAGMIMTFLCCMLLKFYNRALFGDMPLFQFSLVGIAAGVVVGFLTVTIASFVPARRAARVSPVTAVTGSSEMEISKRKKRGLLTKVLHAEIAMGINNATVRKKTLFLMSCSIGISVVMFFGFQVLVDFLHSSLKTTKPYTPDITLTSDQGLSRDLYAQLTAVDGVKRVYGRMFGYVDATFDASRLTATYRNLIGDIAVGDDRLFVPPESSWLISYDKNQLNWAKEDLVDGELSEDKINAQNGLIAVALPLRKNVVTETTTLRVGDKVYVPTPSGTRECTVMALLRQVPFSDSKLTLTTFVTTEKMFSELTGASLLKAIDIQLERRGGEQAVNEIKGMLDGSISIYDARQKNAELDQTFFTMAVFIYGFVAIIALISVLNIVNTMNTSVAAKTRYLGVMRAVGMSGQQLDRMVLVEAATYSLTGFVAGCVLGIALQKALVANLLSQLHVVWRFPAVQIALALILILLVTVVSVITPLRRIKSKGISEVVNSL